MDRIRHIAYAFIAASFLTACMQYESEMLSDGTLPLTLTASIEGGIATRATVDNTWDGGEVIALQVNGEDWYDYTADAYGNLTGNYYWQNNNSITVQGIYPATVVENMAWSVNSDQSNDAAYRSGDLLASNIQTVSYGGTADLEFYHQTAKVVVNVKKAGLSDAISAAAEDINVIIGEEDNLVLEAGFSFPTAVGVGGRWLGTWEPGTEKGSVTPHLSETTADGCIATYEALVIPQTITSDTRLLTFNVTKDGTGYGPFYYTLPSEIEWEAGYVYTYNVSIFFYGVDVSVSTGMVWNEGESGEVEGDYTYDTETNTYTVFTANGLKHLAEFVNGGATDINITLTTDLNLTDIDWTPIGYYNRSNDYKAYTGTFEGGGHTITGLTFNQSETNYVGLIGYLGSGGKVQNLTLDNINITGYQIVGGVVGANQGTVTACTALGSISGDNHVGGVVGSNWGTVTACTAFGSVSGSGYQVGGVVGASVGTVTACTASCSVSGSGYYVGGVVGANVSVGTVTACSASGSVSGTDGIGGVVGANQGTITACSASGSVSGTDEIGGVVGWNNGTVTACYHATGSVSGSGNYVGGVVGYNYYGTVTVCYWSDYEGNGIGYTEGDYTVETTEVDGSDVTWSDAVDSMNEAIDTWNSENTNKQCDWKYELTGDLPTLTKNEE